MEGEGKLERSLGMIKSLNLTNILILALIVIIALPAYFAYRFIIDTNFRREFMSSASILDSHVPCVVFEGRRYGSVTRHTVVFVYGHEGRNEKIIGLRAPGTMNDKEIEQTCQQVLTMAHEMKP
jgi:hypothetical protein